MNQILTTKLKKKNIKKFFKFQLVISILLLTVILFLVVKYFFTLYSNEKISNNIKTNYDISKLYKNSNSVSDNDSNPIFGTIYIPKINISYIVYNTLSDELLKISPCKFFGTTPKESGNICIAGHNYNNSLFFSNISLLNNNDIIYIFDSNQLTYSYYVYDCYEVDSSDLSPIFDYSNSKKTLTLITCNNLNSKRIIVKSAQ